MRGSGHQRLRVREMWYAIILASALSGGSVAGAAAQSGGQLVRPGIDVLLTDSTALLRGRRIGFLTNLSAVDRQGVSDITRLRGAGVNLVALFSPEHGLNGTAAPGQRVASGFDSTSNLPIYSLYGQTTAPTPAMLAGIDLLLVDLPDVGARYFTYLATTIAVMKAAAPLHIPVVILDRPNPIGGSVQGNILDTAYRSAVGSLAVPMRHGLTLAEAARLAKSDLVIPVELRVVPVAGWTRRMTQDQTGLPFLPPSPNLKDLESLFHYPGLCLFEGTSLSVGRGTDLPFHQIGAMWLDTAAVLQRVRAAKLPGVRFEGVTFQPKQPGDSKWADSTVKGIRLVMTDATRYDPVRTALTLMIAIRAVHPAQMTFNPSFDRLAGGPMLREAIQRGESAARIVTAWSAGLASFQKRVAGLLLYK